MSKAPFRPIAALLLFWIAISVSPASIISAAEIQEWVVVQIEGSVEFKRGGSPWRALRRGDTVVPGYEIRTGVEAKVLLTRGSETITIEPKSALEFLPAGRNSVTRIFQKIGGAIFSIKDRNRQKFEVLTPNFVAAVKGTEFSIRTDSNGATLNVMSGTVGVTNKKSGKSVDVSAGQFAMIMADSGAIATGNLAVRATNPFATYGAIVAVISAFLGVCFILYIVAMRKRACMARAARSDEQTVKR